MQLKQFKHDFGGSWAIQFQNKIFSHQFSDVIFTAEFLRRAAEFGATIFDVRLDQVTGWAGRNVHDGASESLDFYDVVAAIFRIFRTRVLRTVSDETPGLSGLQR